MGQATPPSPPPQNQNQLARCVGWHHQQSTFADWARLSVSGFPAEQSKGLKIQWAVLTHAGGDVSIADGIAQQQNGTWKLSTV